MPQPYWLAPAWADLGVAERPGAESTAAITRYFADIGQPAIADDETAWCAAFVGACLERAGIRSTRSLLARSYLEWGTPLADFHYGAIAVLSRGADPAFGHVAFLVGETAGNLVLLGGNQGDAVSVAAFPRERLVGLRWPSPPTPSAAEGSVAVDERPSTTPADIFDRALAHVLEMEGGYSDDPYDPGGPTNFGITLSVYAREQGAELTTANAGALASALKRISPDLVRRIYLGRYWRPARCPDLPPAVAFFHFDAAVNQGVAGAARMLQQALDVAADGEIGPLTLAAAYRQPADRVLARYADIRRRRYRSLPHFWRFGKGWLRRVDVALARANDLPRATPPTATVNPTESNPMATPKTPAPDAPTAATSPDLIDTKWWGRSLTIWGIIVTTLSTVLPALGPALGVNITADLIRQLGDNVVIFGQALGGLIGTLMAIYGRLRATVPVGGSQFFLKMRAAPRR